MSHDSETQSPLGASTPKQRAGSRKTSGSHASGRSRGLSQALLDYGLYDRKRKVCAFNELIVMEYLSSFGVQYTGRFQIVSSNQDLTTPVLATLDEQVYWTKVVRGTQ